MQANTASSEELQGRDTPLSDEYSSCKLSVLDRRRHLRRRKRPAASCSGTSAGVFDYRGTSCARWQAARAQATSSGSGISSCSTNLARSAGPQGGVRDVEYERGLDSTNTTSGLSVGEPRWEISTDGEDAAHVFGILSAECKEGDGPGDDSSGAGRASSMTAGAPAGDTERGLDGPRDGSCGAERTSSMTAGALAEDWGGVLDKRDRGFAGATFSGRGEKTSAPSATVFKIAEDSELPVQGSHAGESGRPETGPFA